MIAPNPRNPEARRYFEELDAKRERIRMSGGEFQAIGVPLTAEERDWLMVYLVADRRMKDRVPTPRPTPWWRRSRRP